MSPLPYIVVVGCSFVGWMAAQQLAAEFRGRYRILVIEPNSHFSWLFAFPRFASAATGANIQDQVRKAFLPFQPGLFFDEKGGVGSIVQAKVEHVTQISVKLDRDVKLDGCETSEVPFRFLVIATGVELPLPSIPYGATKKEGVDYLLKHSARIQRSQDVVVIGAGAVGVQMSLDIKELFPEKTVTLVHSRRQVMGRFHSALHDIIMDRMHCLGVHVKLGSRVCVPEGGFSNEGSPFEVICQNGTRIPADFAVVCTGQTPRSDLLRAFAHEAIDDSGFIRVRGTLQVAHTALENIFAIGDVADTGATKAAWCGFEQTQVVTRNISRLLKGENVLEDYVPPVPGIRMSLGLHKGVLFRNPEIEGGEAFIEYSEAGKIDLGIDEIWKVRHGGSDYDA